MKRVALFIFALACPYLANAQMSADRAEQALVGLGSIAFYIEPLDDSDKLCGITEQGIRDAFLYPVSSSKLHISRDLSGPIFHVQITTIVQQQPRQCISSVAVQVFEFKNVPLDFSHGAAPEVALVIWNDEWLRVTNLTDHGERVRAVVRQSTEKFLTRWNLANRTTPK